MAGLPKDETSASEHPIKFDQTVFGHLNGGGVEDAAIILVTDTGGSGTSFDLAGVLNESGQPVNVGTRPVLRQGSRSLR